MTIPVDPFPYPDTEQLVGRLLVASPLLSEPTFGRTVIAVLEHNDDGALGVVLNRETSVPVADVLPQWVGQLSEPPVLYAGGPVSDDSVLAVAELAEPTGRGTPLAGWRPCFDRVGLVDLDVPVDLFGGAIAAMRLFAGYAGWGEGQLESEIGEGSWYVAARRPGDVFGVETAGLWRRVLRRQRPPVAYASTHAEQPELN